MKIVVYTISKNEEHNVNKFMDSIKDVPVYILDTGSSDRTVELLRSRGAIVKEKIITPWRFDYARQEALNMIPEDVDLCVSIDMDERLEDGWLEKLKSEWIEGSNFGNYIYIGEWQDKEKTIPALQAARTRIHARHGFHWEKPVHEMPVPDNPNDVKNCNTTIIVKHYSDDKQRNYEPLLTKILELNPKDVDARLQRASEYCQKKEWENALIDYKSWLKLTFNDEQPITRFRRSAVYISMAQCYFNLNDNEQCIRNFFYALAAEPTCKEAWVNLAYVQESLGNYELAYGMAITATKIKDAPYFATRDIFCWGNVSNELAKRCLSKITESKVKET